MKKTLTIAKHEFRLTANTKAYKIITILGPFLIILVTVVPSLISSRGAGVKDTVIGVTGAAPDFFAALRPILEEAKIIPIACGSEAECRDLIRSEEIQGFLVLPKTFIGDLEIVYYSRTATDIAISETLKAIVGRIIVSRRLSEAGLDPGKVAELTRMPGVTVKKVSKEGLEEKSQDFLSILLTGIAFIMLLYMTVLLYGQMIGRSIVTEKTSKTVELMLSSVKPTELMFGKIFGLGFAGLLQYAVWLGIGALLITLVGPLFHLNLPTAFTAGSLGFLLLFFLLAFFLYSSAYAALGAAAEDEQHLGQLAWPLIFFLALPLVLVSPIIMNPDSVLVTVLSFIPMTSPIVLFARTLVDMPPAWELLLGIAVTLGTIILFVKGAGKIFRVGILMTGKRFALKEILRWTRYK